MSTSLKPFQLIGAKGGAPNPWKVAMVIEQLGLPWEFVNVGDEFFKAVKQEPFTKLNPNGRVPAFVDPNKNNLVVWESGAIIEYLVEQYDPENRLSAPSTDLSRKWQERALLHFQMSGQGPYFGQVVWFHKYHAQKHPDVVERYLNEAERVTGVLDNMLKQSKGPWLTGEKLSYADVAFVPWFLTFENIYDEARPGFSKDMDSKYTAWAAWWKEVRELEGVKKVLSIYKDGNWTAFGDKSLADLAKEVGV